MKLTKTKKGDTFIYEVTNENGTLTARRISKRDFVACTAYGDYFFSRLDLVGKGVHGRFIKYWEEVLEDPNADFNRCFSGAGNAMVDKESWIRARIKYTKDRLDNLLSIVKL